SLAVPPDRRAFLEDLLSADERVRESRYRLPAARERFVVARGTLREILGRYSGLPPEQLRFSYPCVCGRVDCVPSQRKPRLGLARRLAAPGSRRPQSPSPEARAGGSATCRRPPVTSRRSSSREASTTCGPAGGRPGMAARDGEPRLADGVLDAGCAVRGRGRR